MRKIILASISPRRKELFGLLGIDFEVIGSDYEEDNSLELSPEEIVKKFAYEKAKSVADKNKGIVIGSDTIVVLNNQVLGKPKDKEEAFKMLKDLSGKFHEVYTGLAVIDSEKTKEKIDYSVTKVKFRDLSDDEILKYIESGEPFDKAGAYGIQGKASIFVEKIDGDYFTIMGLPVCKLALMLKDFGAL